MTIFKNITNDRLYKMEMLTGSLTKETGTQYIATDLYTGEAIKVIMTKGSKSNWAYKQFVPVAESNYR